MRGGTRNCPSRSHGTRKHKIVSQLLATGGPPGVIQRRGVGRRNGEINKAGQATGAPGFIFINFMFPPCGMNLPFLILYILSIPVKPFDCGYAALRSSW